MDVLGTAEAFGVEVDEVVSGQVREVRAAGQVGDVAHVCSFVGGLGPRQGGTRAGSGPPLRRSSPSGSAQRRGRSGGGAVSRGCSGHAAGGGVRCLCRSPPLRPWISAGRARWRGRRVVVEGVWSLVPARGGRGPFSLGRGLDCGLVLLQAGHHLLGNRVSGNKKGDLSVALAKLGHMRFGSTAGASLRGHRPSCAGKREASAAWRRGSRWRCRTSYSWLGSGRVRHRREKCKPGPGGGQADPAHLPAGSRFRRPSHAIR